MPVCEPTATSVPTRCGDAPGANIDVMRMVDNDGGSGVCMQLRTSPWSGQPLRVGCRLRLAARRCADVVDELMEALRSDGLDRPHSDDDRSSTRRKDLRGPMSCVALVRAAGRSATACAGGRAGPRGAGPARRGRGGGGRRSVGLAAADPTGLAARAGGDGAGHSSSKRRRPPAGPRRCSPLRCSPGRGGRLRAPWSRTRHRSANMDSLIAVGTVAAFVYSIYELLAGGDSRPCVAAPAEHVRVGLGGHDHLHAPAVVLEVLARSRTPARGPARLRRRAACCLGCPARPRSASRASRS